jgi:hypothetical protein
VTITDKQKQQFRDEGFFLLERALSDEQLQILRDECARFIDLIHADLDRLGTDKDPGGFNQRGKRYFIGNRYQEGQRLHEVLFCDLMAAICRATIGPNAYLFVEQYVLKCAEVGQKFAWHQDSGYVGHEHRPYVSCWCALDDMSEANGTVYMLPYSRAGVRRRVDHRKEEGSNDMVGYFGDDPGDPVICPAGSIAVFSSVCFHRSGTNTTQNMRRVYLAQYSPEPIMSADGSRFWNKAEPFLRDGQRVR